MFSLIVVILSIVLVAALALTVMYYGGSAMGQGSSKAEASKLINQGQQIMGAADLYKSDTGDWPQSLTSLVTGKYLKTLPVGSMGQAWVMPKAGVPTFVLEDVQKDSCKTINALTFKTDGVRDRLSSTYATQCYSPSSDSFKVVVTKAGTDMVEPGPGACPAGTSATGLPGLGSIECTSAPSDCDDASWVVKPTFCGTGGPGGPGPIDPGPVDPPPAPGSAKLGYFIDGSPVSAVEFYPGTEPYGWYSLEIKNISSKPVTFLSGWSTVPPYFLDDEYNDCQGNVLPSGASCFLDVNLDLTEAPAAPSQLVPLALDESFAGIPLSVGKYIKPGSFYIENAPQFPETIIKQTAAPQKPVLVNGLSETIRVTGISVDNPDYTVSPGTCQYGTDMSAMTSCELSVTFKPSQAGALAGTARVATSKGTYTFQLKGTGVSVLSVAAGLDHVCVLVSSGGVKCWGENGYGQLGAGTLADSAVPLDVVGLNSGVSMLSVGYNHSCALTNSGTVKCWGQNGDGQLGDGTKTNRSSPVTVQGLTGVQSISAGGHTTCAVVSGGTVKCWGQNRNGQVGDGTDVSRLVPVNVVGMTSGVASISVGDYHTCGLTLAGGVKCWGTQGGGQLGNGVEANDYLTAVDVLGLPFGIKSVSSGPNHTCVVTSSGGVQCWGDGSFRQLGTGNYDNSSTPVNVVGMNSGVARVSSGMLNTCALTQLGGVACWGSGFPEFATSVPGWEAGVAQISAGGRMTCATRQDGSVECFKGAS